jgi:hypothetical protein
MVPREIWTRLKVGAWTLAEIASQAGCTQREAEHAMSTWRRMGCGDCCRPYWDHAIGAHRWFYGGMR